MNQNKDIEFIYATKISKISNLLEENKSQLFFVDDFWGSKFDGNLNAEEENNLKKIISIITKSKNKILILTSREYILSQGYAEYPELEEFFDRYKLNLYIEDYSDLFKAQILFRHLANSNLDMKAIYQITGKYDDIIHNENYRPRIIENYIKYLGDKEIETKNYVRDFINYLNHPDKLWKEIFEKQQEGAQIITILILLLGETYTKLEHIRELYNKYINYAPKTEAKKKDFLKYISQLENTLITTYQEKWVAGETIFVKFKNSSIENYIYKHFIENTEEYAKILVESTPYINIIMHLIGSWSILTRYQDKANKKEGIYYDAQKNKEIINMAKKRIINDFENLGFINVDLLSGYSESEEYHVHKIILCLQIYQKYPSEDLKEFIKEQSIQILKELKTNAYFDYDDLFDIPKMFQELRKTEIINDVNPTEIMQDVLAAIRFSIQINILKDFEKWFPKEYEIFYKENKNKIISCIYHLIIQDAKVFVSKGLYDDLDELIEITVPNLFDTFLLNYTPKFMDTFYNITSKRLLQDNRKEEKEGISIDIDYNKIQEKQDKPIQNTKRKQEQEAILKEKQALFDSLYDDRIEKEEVHQYFKQTINHKKLVQELINLFSDYDKNYIRGFMEDWIEKLGYVQYLERFYQHLIACQKLLSENIEVDLRKSFKI